MDCKRIRRKSSVEFTEEFVLTVSTNRLQDMFDQDETSVEKCGHSYLDNGCVVRTDYHFNY